MCSWNALATLRVRNTAINGTFPDCWPVSAGWESMVSLDVSHTQMSGSVGALFNAIPHTNVLVSLLASSTRISGDIVELFELANGTWARGIKSVDFSQTLVSGWLSSSNIGGWTALQSLRLGGSKVSGQLDGSFAHWRALTTLDLSGTRVSGAIEPALTAWTSLETLVLSYSAVSGELLGNFTSWARLVHIAVDYTSISGRIDSLLNALGTPVAVASGSMASICFESGAGASTVVSWAIQNLRVADECDAAMEERLQTTLFAPCSQSGIGDPDGGGGSGVSPASGLYFNSTFCTQSQRFAGFADRLSCPAWSSTATRGVAALEADPSFLGFWGCECPSGFFWGYDGPPQERLTGIRQELALEASGASFGRLFAARRQRKCVPCPPFVVCNSLTVAEAPHQLQGSRYPLPVDLPWPPRVRQGFVYATLLSCLHPSVCNRAPALTAASWPEWSQLRADGVTAQSTFNEFLCREGHDAASLMCSRCEEGYWQNGFLCERCLEGFGALVVVGLLICSALLALYIANRALLGISSHETLATAYREQVAVGGRGDSLHRAQGQRAWAAPPAGAAQIVATTLWYFQVSAALSVSSQVKRWLPARAWGWRSEPVPPCAADQFVAHRRFRPLIVRARAPGCSAELSAVGPGVLGGHGVDLHPVQRAHARGALGDCGAGRAPVAVRSAVARAVGFGGASCCWIWCVPWAGSGGGGGGACDAHAPGAAVPPGGTARNRVAQHGARRAAGGAVLPASGAAHALRHGRLPRHAGGVSAHADLLRRGLPAAVQLGAVARTGAYVAGHFAALPAAGGARDVVACAVGGAGAFRQESDVRGGDRRLRFRSGAASVHRLLRTACPPPAAGALRQRHQRPIIEFRSAGCADCPATLRRATPQHLRARVHHRAGAELLWRAGAGHIVQRARQRGGGAQQGAGHRLLCRKSAHCRGSRPACALPQGGQR